MKIYIASSWRNQHAVEMMTALLMQNGHTVVSFVERAIEEEGRSGLRFDIEEWINSGAGADKFEYDLAGATTSDIVVYIGPAGTDAWAEVGAAYARGIPILGLWAKSESAGLMRRMVEWYLSYRDILAAIA